MDVKTSLHISGEPILASDSVTKSEAKPKSMAESAPKYVRKTSTEMLSKIWEIIDANEWFKSVDEMNKCLSKKMFKEFNIKLNDNKIKQIMETALTDRLVIREETDNKIRYSLISFVRK